MVEKEVFYEAKASIHLSQWGKWIYGAQLLKERRFFSESVFIPIKRWTLILTNGWKRICSYETKESIQLSQLGEWICDA